MFFWIVMFSIVTLVLLGVTKVFVENLAWEQTIFLNRLAALTGKKIASQEMIIKEDPKREIGEALLTCLTSHNNFVSVKFSVKELSKVRNNQCSVCYVLKFDDELKKSQAEINDLAEYMFTEPIDQKGRTYSQLMFNISIEKTDPFLNEIKQKGNVVLPTDQTYAVMALFKEHKPTSQELKITKELTMFTNSFTDSEFLGFAKYLKDKEMYATITIMPYWRLRNTCSYANIDLSKIPSIRQ
ncbi:hypothetical protein ACFL0W_05150 [Nanoarchaeota archaeon]